MIYLFIYGFINYPDDKKKPKLFIEKFSIIRLFIEKFLIIRLFIKKFSIRRLIIEKFSFRTLFKKPIDLLPDSPT